MSALVASRVADYRCASWTRARGADPVGSALTCDTLVLIETPPPWPRDVSGLSIFADLLGRGFLRTRFLAVRPESRPAEVRATALTIWRRIDTGDLLGTDHVVPSDRVADVVARLLDDPLIDPAASPSPAEVLVCGHGARDSCCGRLGTRFALDAAAAWPSGPRVRRCSHTGGHRYAPTGFTLPDGRAWGFLDLAVLDRIVRRSGPPPLRGHYRGTTALDGFGQVVERELFERFGWGWLDHQLVSAHTETAPDGRSASVELAWRGPTGPGTAQAQVQAVRDLPVLLCGQPPENAPKTAPELAVASLTLRPTRSSAVHAAAARPTP